MAESDDAFWSWFRTWLMLIGLVFIPWALAMGVIVGVVMIARALGSA